MGTQYRVRSVLFREGLFIVADRYRVIKETPKGYWVVGPSAPFWTLEELRKFKFAKWVSRSSKKRLCYPDLGSAVESFIRRKKRQASILRFQLEQAELAIQQSDVYRGAGVEALRAGVNVGEIPSQSGVIWDWLS